MTELQILNAVNNNGGSIDYVGLLNLGLTDPVCSSVADKRLIEKMIQGQILSGKTEAYSLITFGRDGRLRLRELQQSADNLTDKMAYEQSEKNADRRFQSSQTIFGIVIGSILTLIAEIIVEVFFG